ncbi:flavin-containing monooxygenase [Novosphingobium sp. BL-52-GroH]|uniref:flavin-containing monooxygenase n=1 Tax=Novosphingobium sp. BL-52-GroH TaxID=3349877 RepID=UPI00384F46E7
MSEIDLAVQAIVGSYDHDPDELAKRYAYERDVRLRPDANRQYIEVKAEFSHYADDPYSTPTTREPLRDHTEVAIVGGGIGGIMCAVRLREAGFEDIRIIDKAGDFSGCWYWNRYPGLRCDTESYVYLPMVEDTGEIPPEKYVTGAYIREYMLDLARKHDLYRQACLQTAVTGLAWNEAAKRWHIHTDRGDDMTATFVVLANGLLDRPKLPGIPGIDTFKGHTFHTSRWDYAYTGGDERGDLVKLADKRVGIVGTGATGVQVIPRVAQYAGHLDVFQRTPAAVDIRANRPTDPVWAQSLQAGWQRARIDNFNLSVAGRAPEIDLVNDGFSQVGKLLDPTANWAARLLGRPISEEEGEYITNILDDKKMIELRARVDAVVKDPATAEALKPWHRRWCKRPLFSDEYLEAFNRPNVSLVDTAGRGIERITERGAVVAGREHPLDCLIFATGFDVGIEFTRRIGYDVVGREGVELSQLWKDGMRTYQGVFVPNFPNLLMTGSGQNASAVVFTFPLQEQAKHVAHTLSQMRARGATTVEPLPEAVASYVDECKPMSISQRKFWIECTPSYMNGEGEKNNPHGFYANAHPAGTVDFYRMLAEWRDEGALSGLKLR